MGSKNIFDGVSKIGIGFMRLPPDWESTSVPYTEILDYAINSGVNLFECAYFYNDGNCDDIVHKLLTPYSRDSYKLVNKMPLNGYLDNGYIPQRIFQTQLLRHNTTYFDFYLIQAINRWNIDTVKQTKLIEYLDFKKKCGHIKHLGFSFHDNEDTLLRALDLYDWEFVMIQLNWLDYFNGVAKGLVHILQSRGIPFNAMCVTKGGLLYDKKRLPSKVIRDTQYDMVDIDISFVDALGTTVQMHDLGDPLVLKHAIKKLILDKTHYGPFGIESLDTLKTMADDYRKHTLIPCTGCGYCEVGCPKNIKISQLFNDYNNIMSKDTIDYEQFDSFAQKGVKTGYYHRCIGCGNCSKKCPQGIDIGKELRSTLFNYRY